MTHARTSSVCLSVCLFFPLAHRFLLFVHLPFLFASLAVCQLLSASFFQQTNIHPLKVHLGCGWGGREGCSGWAFLLSLRWQQDRGAIDSSTGPHSWLMLECVISWQFSHTEIDRAEFLSCTVHFGFSALRVISFYADRKWWSDVAFCLKRQEKGSCMRHVLKPVDYQTIYYFVLPTASRQQELKRLRFWEGWRPHLNMKVGFRLGTFCIMSFLPESFTALSAVKLFCIVVWLLNIVTPSHTLSHFQYTLVQKRQKLVHKNEQNAWN